MTTYVITLEYGDPLPAGVGAFDHPAGDGTSAALQVRDVVEFDTVEEAHDYAQDIDKFNDPMVHSIEVRDGTPAV